METENNYKNETINENKDATNEIDVVNNRSMLDVIPRDLLIHLCHSYFSIKQQICLFHISQEFQKILEISIKQYPINMRKTIANDVILKKYIKQKFNWDEFTHYLYHEFSIYDDTKNNFLYNKTLHVSLESGSRTVGIKYESLQIDTFPTSIKSITIPVPYITVILSKRICNQLRFLHVKALENIAKTDHFNFSGDSDEEEDEIRVRENKEFNEYIYKQFDNLIFLSLTSYFYHNNIDIYIPTQIQTLFVNKFDENHPLKLHLYPNEKYNLCEIKFCLPLYFDEKNKKCSTFKHCYDNMVLFSTMNTICIIELMVILKGDKDPWGSAFNLVELNVFDKEYHNIQTIMFNIQ
eukprot:317162_1